MTDAPDGSIVRRESPRPDLLVFEIRAKITKPDIEWMAAVSENAFDARDETDMLLILSGYDGMETGAMFDRDMFRAQGRAARRVRRYAVVGAPLWARAMIEASSALSPVESNTFDLDDEPAARAWVDGAAG